MHLGYSILLGEHYPAEGVSYDDCRASQIVCPSCREPVFKVVRESPADPIQYLSHYAAAEAYAADCELRVRSMASRDIEAADAASRGQRLKLFLQVLRDTVLSSEYESGALRERAEQLAKRFRESKRLRRYREMMFEHAHDSFRGMQFDHAEELLDDYVIDFRSSGAEFPLTGFAIDVQKRIAWDVWTHVLSRVAQGNYYFLLSHAAVHFLARLDLAARERPLDPYVPRFTREELQTLAPLSQKVRSVHGERHPEVIDVADLVRQLVEAMPSHMLKEEQVERS